MSLEAAASQPLGLLQCGQCGEEFEDARKLFRHVESVDPDRTSTCLEDMGMQMEEFRRDYTRRRRKAARRKFSLGVCLFVRIFVKLYSGRRQQLADKVQGHSEVRRLLPLLQLPDAEFQEGCVQGCRCRGAEDTG